MDSDYRFVLIPADKSRARGSFFGPYEFRTLGTTMLVKSFLSSSSKAQVVGFSFENSFQTLEIENFYDFDAKEKTLTFRKVK